VWLETPSNPNLDVCDIAAIVERAHQAGALVAVDNTTATILAQRPLALGADFSVASDTKAMSGHSDLLLGHVAARDPNWMERVRQWRTLVGAAPGPMDVWLAHRSLATLDVRLERQTANALAIARHLVGRPELVDVRYPGLEHDPAHAVAARQMSRFGTVVGLVFIDKNSADAFLDHARLITQATSFGGVHTTAERRMRWGNDGVSEGFVRLSVGVEHAADLIADIDQALAAAPESAPGAAR
jgi:cystathionine gamma-lyase